MPSGMEAPPSRSSRRRRIVIPLGAVFVGCVLVPTLPASADPTLSLRLEGLRTDPGTSFSLPLSVTNTLDSSVVAISEATATADAPTVGRLEVTGLPAALDPRSGAEAEVTGTVPEDAAGSEIRVEVVVDYSYEVPCDSPSPSGSPQTPGPPETPEPSETSEPPQTPEPSETSTPPPPPGSPPASVSPAPPDQSGAAASPVLMTSPSGDECVIPLDGTAEVSAVVTVVEPATTPDPTAGSSGPTRSPDRGREPDDRTSAPPATSTPPDRDPPAPRTPRRPPAPHSPVSTSPPGTSIPSRGRLPTGAPELPELSAPTDEYADLPLVTPGEEDHGDNDASTVAREEDRADPLTTPFVLLLALMLLLLLATPLGPVRRVRVTRAYVGRRRRH